MRTAVLLAVSTMLAAACGGSSSGATRVAPHEPSRPAPRREGVADPGFLEQYAATQGFRLGEPVDIQIAPDETEVLFLRSGPRSFVRDLYSFDTRTGQERVLLTADGILGGEEEQLSDVERARRERLRLAARGIASYELSSDGAQILVPLSGRLFVVNRESRESRELQTGEGYPNDAHFSPDGTKVAFVRDGDLYVVDVASGRERRLTRSASEHVVNGLAEFVAQEEMDRYRGYWWSPDGRSILYQHTDTSAVEQLSIADPMHPEQPAQRSPYPRPGKANAKVELGIVPVNGGETRWVRWDQEAFPYLTTVRWSAAGPLLLVVQDRRQHEERVLVVDPQTLATRTLFTEQDDAWLNIDQDVPRYVAGGRQLLWTTEREGGWQLELRDATDGHLVRALAPPDFGYEAGGLLSVDERASELWVRASADPVQEQLWILPLGDGEPRQITREPGIHDATVGQQIWVHEAQLLDGTRLHTVMRGNQRLGELRSVSETPPFVPSLEITTVGERDLRAVVIRPRNFETGRRYPVLDSVYGGPHWRSVRASPYAFLLEQWYADHGYVVVSIDGRGTPGRGRAWERAIAGNFIDVPLADQVDGLHALGERFPEMDLRCVGIWGWSFGGYFSAMAVMREPEVFHAGVAGAPVADWTDYDTHYTERYLGLPSENAEGYRRSSVLTYASQLSRPLLIVHGTVDDNVYFTHAIKMSDALLRASRPHDFLPLSGFTHMVADPDVTRARHTLIERWFEQNLCPSAGVGCAAAPIPENGAAVSSARTGDRSHP